MEMVTIQIHWGDLAILFFIGGALMGFLAGGTYVYKKYSGTKCPYTECPGNKE